MCKKYSFLFFNFMYLFLDREEGREKEGEKHQCVVASYALPSGDPVLRARVPSWENLRGKSRFYLDEERL